MPSEGLIIVAEGIEDVHLIRTILANELTADMRFFAGQGRMSLTSLARNLLVHEGGPVLVVMDADTLNPRLRQEQQSLVMVAMSSFVKPGSSPFSSSLMKIGSNFGTKKSTKTFRITTPVTARKMG